MNRSRSTEAAMMRWLILLVALLALQAASCGQKGPLELPPEEASRAQAATAPLPRLGSIP